MGLLFFLLFLLFAIFSASLEPSPFEVSSMIYIYINIYDGVARFSKVFLFFFVFFFVFSRMKTNGARVKIDFESRNIIESRCWKRDFF